MVVRAIAVLNLYRRVFTEIHFEGSEFIQQLCKKTRNVLVRTPPEFSNSNNASAVRDRQKTGFKIGLKKARIEMKQQKRGFVPFRNKMTRFALNLQKASDVSRRKNRTLNALLVCLENRFTLDI